MKRPLAVPVELKGRLYHTKRPDIDNLEKALLDGLGDAGIFGDDAQVCVRLPGGKFYGAEGERVGVEVVLRWGRELVGNSFGERAE
jgi:Holliday junction resolvase RusA-like endonuclease